MQEDTSFGRWLQRRRTALGLTQQELGQHVGCARATIRKIEADERRPSREIAERLAIHLQVVADELPAFVRFARGETSTQQPSPFQPQPEGSPWRTRAAVLTNLPVQRRSLLGREQEVREVKALLRRDDVGLVTLTGPGGIGKTRLALQIATEFLDDVTDGVWFVDLTPIKDANLVLATAAQTLGVKETPGESLAETFTAYLCDKRLLLVLDNFEQVVDAAPALAGLLQAVPGLKLLVTSRFVLHLSDEHQYPVPPLSLPDLSRQQPLEQLAQYAAVQLFIQRAQAVKPDIDITNAVAQVVASICIRLDGLPLAIELAAARSKLFSPEALLHQLERRLKTVVGGARDLAPRQQTLRNTIDWSYNLLEPIEQQLFTRLAVFTGGWSVETAEAVCNAQHELGTDSAVILEALVDKSFVHSVDITDGERRFTMLETIHEYALEQLADAGEAALLQRQHRDQFLHLAETAEQQLEDRDQILWFERLEREHSNLRAALTWCQVDPASKRQGLRLAAALGQFWSIRGYADEGRDWLRAALVQTEEEEPELVRTKALLGAGTLAAGQGDYEAARVFYEEGLRISWLITDTVGRARSLRKLGGLAYSQGAYDRAMELHETSLELFQEVGDEREIGSTLWTIGVVAIAQGDHARARIIFEDRIVEHRQRGNKLGLAGALTNLGVIAQAQGDYIQAEQCHRESLPFYRQLGDQDGIALALLNLGFVAYCQSDYQMATAHYVESCVLHQKIGDQEGIAGALIGLAGVAAAQAQSRRAARLLGAGEAILEAIGAATAVSNGDIDPEQVAAAMRTQLGEAVFLHERAEGRVMGPQVVLEQDLE